jgi:hypothetical protein
LNWGRPRVHRTLLKEFLQYVAKQKPDGPIPAQMVVDWACSTPHADAVASQSFRLSIARAFLIHVKTVFPETEIPPHLYLMPQRRPTPCLFLRLFKSSRILMVNLHHTQSNCGGRANDSVSPTVKCTTPYGSGNCHCDRTPRPHASFSERRSPKGKVDCSD